jgi:hypothetical protein
MLKYPCFEGARLQPRREGNGIDVALAAELRSISSSHSFNDLFKAAG